MGMAVKGFEELTKTYIYLAVVLLFISFAISPLYQSIAAAKKDSAQLSAKQIAGIINMEKASSSQSVSYNLAPPSGRCSIQITSGFVDIRIDKIDYIEEIIQTPVDVVPSSVDCSKNIMIVKQDNMITIFQR